MTERETDAVNHPEHYRAAGGLECIEVIEALGLGYHLGNVLKYLWRAERKGSPVEDLSKARWYLDREIARRQRDAAQEPDTERTTQELSPVPCNMKLPQQDTTAWWDTAEHFRRLMYERQRDCEAVTRERDAARARLAELEALVAALVPQYEGTSETALLRCGALGALVLHERRRANGKANGK